MEDSNEPEVVQQVENKLDDKNLSVHDLEALKSELKAEISSIRRDKNSDAEEKSAMLAKIDKLQENLDHLISAQEERDRKHNDESTIVIPPPELDPPTHQNPTNTDVQAENDRTPAKKQRLSWW